MSGEWFELVGPTKIIKNIWLSGYKVASELWNSNPMGITHVLNVSTNPPYLKSEAITYMDCPFHDGDPIPAEKFAACMAFLKIADEQEGTILVHCAAGISRSAVIVAAFLHYSNRMEFNDAVSYIMSRRPIVNPSVNTLNSARKLLRAWPYDGSMQMQTEDKKLVEDTVLNLVINQAKKMHPNPECPVREMLLRSYPGNIGENTPRHTIKCTCSLISK